MAGDLDLGYTTRGLRDGAERSGESADAARRAHQVLAATTLSTTMFGDVDRATELVGHVTTCRDTFQATGEGTDRAHLDLQGRAGDVAGMGAQLRVTTADIARGGTPRAAPADGPVAQGMLG
jgi:hypothetical protein